MLTIRAVEAADAAEWLRLRLALWPDSERDEEADQIAHYFTEPDPPLPDLYAAFVCERSSGGLCGLVEVSIHSSAPGCVTDRIGYLEGWYVDADWRQQGVGRALVQVAEAWAVAQGCTEMASDTDTDYPISPAAHAALGYAQVERFHFCKLL